MFKTNRIFNLKPSRFKKRLTNFLKIFNYVIRQSLRSSLLKHVYVVFLLAAGGVLQVLALLQITILLGNSDKKNSIISSLPLSFLPENISVSFMTGVFLITSTFLIAAICTYSGESRVLRLATDLEEKLINKLLSLLSTQAGILKIISKEMPKAKLYKILLSSTRLAGRFLRLQFSLIQPLLKSIVLLAVLIFIDWALTLSILAVVLSLNMAQYLINIRAVKFSRQFEESNIKSKKFLRSKLELAVTNSNGTENEDISKNEFYQQNKIDYRMRLQVTEESKLVSNITKACLVFMLLASYTNWGEDLSLPVLTALLSYALILIFFLISIQASLACITSMNRFYSQVSEYFNFIDEGQGDSSVTTANTYIPVLSKNSDEVDKIYLNASRILFIQCRKDPKKIHFSLLSTIQIESQGANQSPIDNKKSNIEQSDTLPYIFIDEESPKINNLNQLESSNLKIAYITPQIARSQKQIAVYEIVEEKRLLIPWPNNRLASTEVINEGFDSDDL